MQRIQTDADVLAWRRSEGYNRFLAWIEKRSQRIRGRECVLGEGAYEGCSERIGSLLKLLDDMQAWVDEAPPLPETQRFGNKAFRTYIQLVEERLPSHLPTPPDLTAHLLPLLLRSTAFGQATRLDYGSGHELSWVLGMWVMREMGWVGSGRSDRAEKGSEGGSTNGEAVEGGKGEEGKAVTEEGGELEEDDLILRVFPKYLDLTTLLQKTYNLEPAGSHGVWGLDDYCFLPYVFGAGQMLGMEVTPTQALENAKNKSYEAKDLWTISLRRVFEFKSGPFFEHSPLLHNLSTSMPNFVKIHRGLVKMYQEEVLGKRVVVQHLFLDEITWGKDI